LEQPWALAVKVEMLNVLIVDSNQFTSQTFKRILEKRGYLVELAETRNKAIELIKRDGFDVVLISLENTDVDGIDILFFAKKNLPSATKLITTGFPSIKEGIRALESGADAVFAKPVAPERIIAVIEEIARKQRKHSG
jgi:DNA-binding response OmpR family regulator